MKIILILSMLVISVPSFANRGGKKIKECAGKANEAVCVGLVLNRKLNKIMRRSGGGGPVQVEFFDDEKCQTSMGKGRVRLQNAEQSCKSIIDRISSFGNVDSVSFDGSCLNINNDSSYTKDQLVEQCVNNI